MMGKRGLGHALLLVALLAHVARSVAIADSASIPGPTLADDPLSPPLPTGVDDPAGLAGLLPDLDPSPPASTSFATTYIAITPPGPTSPAAKISNAKSRTTTAVVVAGVVVSAATVLLAILTAAFFQYRRRRVRRPAARASGTSHSRRTGQSLRRPVSSFFSPAEPVSSDGYAYAEGSLKGGGADKSNWPRAPFAGPDYEYIERPSAAFAFGRENGPGAGYECDDAFESALPVWKSPASAGLQIDKLTPPPSFRASAKRPALRIDTSYASRPRRTEYVSTRDAAGRLNGRVHISYGS
ncbi:hypothetical protein GGX14DRAFT_450709 [Mycena pura]|uniref:Transmembrane protein n=1 Tax=Mycena pura TaxID=153505 RepID=A0AAD6VE76_9AGAR|nr:hypothetical protein GGX14DRAFT_450709 [Mycena pura]